MGEEHFVMSVPLDITTFRSVLLVSVILKHPRTRFVTRKMASADAKQSLESELANNVTTDSSTTQIVLPVTVIQRVQLRKFATKIKATAFAKKGMVGSGVIDVRKGGLDIQT